MFLPISSEAEDVGNGSWFLPCGQLHLQLVIQFLFICSLPMSQDIVAMFPVVILKLDKVGHFILNSFNRFAYLIFKLI